jgi:hypothetical protein
MINDGVFELLKHRDHTTRVFVQNSFKKFQDVPAIRMRNEDDFLQALKDHCITKQPFLFGCDSCTVVTKFYQACRESIADPALKEKMLLITAETFYRVTDATEDFKDKFVFYSPKITFGVDFSIDVPQDVFIYIGGNSIQPSGSFQQATRCRNIKSLYYFGEVFQQDAFYSSLEDVKTSVAEAVQTSNTFNTTCTYIDENDQIQVVRNTFFNLYCYNEFVKDTYETNKVKHFELILAKNGFKLSAQGVPTRLAKETRNQQSQLVEAINEELFTEFLQTEVNSDLKFQNIVKAISYLKLPMGSPEILTKFKDVIMDQWKLRDHDSVVRFLKSTDHVDNKLADLSFKGIDVKNLTNGYHKLKIVRQIESDFGINIWEPQAPTKTEMTDEFYRLARTVFRTKLAKPTTSQELVEFYGALIKSATTRKFINVNHGQIKINTEYVTEHLELNGYKNVNKTGFSPEVMAHFGIEVPEGDGFVDASSLGLDD